MAREIEFVCTGNRGRSPLAEAFARRYLSQRDVNSVRVSSSGTLVDYFRKIDDTSLGRFITSNASRFTEVGIVTEEDIEAIRHGRGIRGTAGKITTNEKNNRTIILLEFQLLPYFDQNRQPVQTTTRRGSEFIFPMDHANYERVVNTYSSSNPRPVIKLLGEIDDPIFANLDIYRYIARQLETATIEAMERVL